MKLVILKDPTGLSLNRWNNLHWAERNRIKGDWAHEVGWIAKSKHNKMPFKHATITITCYFRTKHKRDPDNFLGVVGKVCLDPLIGIIIEDDNSEAIDLMPLVFEYSKTKPRVEIEIEETRT